MKKARKKKELLISILDIIMLMKIFQTSNLVDFVKKYKELINNTNLNIVKKLRLTSIKKY